MKVRNKKTGIIYPMDAALWERTKNQKGVYGVLEEVPEPKFPELEELKRRQAEILAATPPAEQEADAPEPPKKKRKYNRRKNNKGSAPPAEQ